MARATTVRIGRSMVAFVVATAGLVTVTQSPAAAATDQTTASTSWGYIDAATPNRGYVGGSQDAPIGSWRDAAGTGHTARSYFTFDISAFVGTTVSKAILVGGETAAADCSARPSIDLWHTKAFTANASWNRPPDDIAKVDSFVRPEGLACPAPYIEWNALRAVKSALADGKRTVTLSLRLQAQLERDVAQGRQVANQPRLTVSYNTAPAAPTDLRTAGEPCDTREPYQLLGLGDVRVSGTFTDPDPADALDVTFSMWPVDRPAQRVEVLKENSVPGVVFHDFPADGFAHGKTYAWRTRVTDGEATTAWSKTCYFRKDTQRPSAPPVVSSVDYPADGTPHDGIGLPGDFSFHPNGVSDVAGYEYGFSDASTFVAADRRGRATVTLTPLSFQSQLVVRSIDHAGNRSDPTYYYFLVNDVRPDISGSFTEVGVPAAFTFVARMAGVVSFRYQLDGESPATVAADDNGRASVEITANRGGDRSLTVTSVTADGVEVSNTFGFSLMTEPIVSGDPYAAGTNLGGPGVEGVFTFRPRMLDVVRYSYSFDAEQTLTVDADADGTATVRWTPDRAGPHMLIVQSISEDGTESFRAWYDFDVFDPLPVVSGSDQFPGVEGSFYFNSQVPDVVAFVYRFDDGPEQVVEGHGYASITYTPEFGGPHTLTVRSRTSDGTLSAPRVHPFTIASAPTVTSAQYPSHTESGGPGVQGTFTFTAPLRDVVEYRYTIEDDIDPPTQTVAADANGTATITWTPSRSGIAYMYVWAVTATGFVSDSREHLIVVGSPNPKIWSMLYQSWAAYGGVGVPGGFQFTSLLPVAEYEYWLNDEAHHTVAAASDGSATVEIAPTVGPSNVLSVRSRTAAGAESEVTTFSFQVNTAPSVSSTIYPRSDYGGGPGVPGEFFLESGMPGSVDFAYSLDGAPTERVPVGPDGRATITVTPPTEGFHALYVNSVSADGTESHQTYYYFNVSPAG